MSLFPKTIIEDGMKIKLYPDGDPCGYLSVERCIDGSFKKIRTEHYKDEYGNTVTLKDDV